MHIGTWHTESTTVNIQEIEEILPPCRQYATFKVVSASMES